MIRQRLSRSRYRVKNGLLSAPSYFTRDQEPQDPQDPNEELLEVHNHIDLSPGEEEQEQIVARYNPSEIGDEAPEEGQGEEEEIGRWPSTGFTVRSEGNEIVLYRVGSGSDSPNHKTDRFDMSARDKSKRAGPPRTLAQLNALHHAHYQSKGGRR